MHVRLKWVCPVILGKSWTLTSEHKELLHSDPDFQFFWGRTPISPYPRWEIRGPPDFGPSAPLHQHAPQIRATKVPQYCWRMAFRRQIFKKNSGGAPPDPPKCIVIAPNFHLHANFTGPCTNMPHKWGQQKFPQYCSGMAQNPPFSILEETFSKISGGAPLTHQTHCYYSEFPFSCYLTGQHMCKMCFPISLMVCDFVA